MVARRQAIALALSMAVVASVKKKQKRRRKVWAKRWLQKRSFLGSYKTIFYELHEDERNFKGYLRMNSDLFRRLLSKIESKIGKQDTVMRDAIPAGARLEATLRWLAAGGSYRSLQFSTRISVSALSFIIPETCVAIYNVLKDDYMKMPRSPPQWQEIADQFHQRWNFPNCVGAIDGKHVLINPPHESGSYYFNYKGSHSIVLLALVDAKYSFLHADVGINGRVSDGGVWNRCRLRQVIENGTVGFPGPATLPGSERTAPFVILGDDAFPLRDYLMKPFPFRDQEKEEKIFSYRLSRARRVVENAFGILANRFRVLLAPINLDPDKVVKVVLATLALHNFLIAESDGQYYSLSELTRENVSNGTIVSGSLGAEGEMLGLQRGNVGTTATAKDVRQTYKNYVNNEGKVSWQENMI